MTAGNAASDVVVVGAGIVGAFCARELVDRGANVTLVDRGPVSGGTTGLGEGNVLCGDRDEGPELSLAVVAMRMWDEIEASLGAQAGIRRKGSLIVHPLEETWALEPARVQRLRRAGVEATLLSADEVRELEPELNGPLHGATHVPGDLQCAPAAITRAVAPPLTTLDVAAVEIEGGRAVGVRSRAGAVLRARHVVLAAGAWSAQLAATAGVALPVEPRKGQLTRLQLAGGRDERFLRQKVIDGSYLLSVLSPSSAREVSTVVETTLEGDVLVGSSRERSGFDPAVDPGLAHEMQQRAARLVPSLADATPVRSWVGFRPWLPDHLPAIGPVGHVPGLHIATGHEGSGVCLGPISGRLVAQAITGERLEHPLEPFDPARFG